MSISTLKKKTQAKYNNMSVGQNQFSLNGAHRSQGWVGQSMLSRSLPRTPMQGQTPKGHGGCCGTYNKSQGIIQSAVSSLNDNDVIKPSVISNKGMLEEKLTPYRNYLMPYPYVSSIPAKHITCTTVKTTDSNQGAIGVYTENLGATVNKKVDSCVKNQLYSGCSNYNAYYRRKICTIVDTPTNKYIHPSDKLNQIKGKELTCDNNLTTPDQYNEIYLKKGIQYNADGTYVVAANPSNGTVLPGPLASY
jgi:hypothetical protein